MSQDDVEHNGYGQPDAHKHEIHRFSEESPAISSGPTKGIQSGSTNASGASQSSATQINEIHPEPAVPKPSQSSSPRPLEFYYLSIREGSDKAQSGHFTEETLLSYQFKTPSEKYVIFLPRITDILKCSYGLSDSFSDRLIEKFNIDKFFLSNTGYESNGFFLNHHFREHAYGCRFLVKELHGIENDPDKKVERKKTLTETRDWVHALVGYPSKKKPEGGMQSTSDKTIHSLLWDLRYTILTDSKWTSEGLTNTALDNLPMEKTPSLLYEDFKEWLETNKDQFPKFRQDETDDEKKKRLDLYEVIDEILLRIWHALDCIGEKREGDRVKDLNPPSSESPSSGTPGTLAKSGTHSQRVELPPSGQTTHSKAFPRPHIRRPNWTNKISHRSEDRPRKDKENPKAEELSLYHWLFLSFWTVDGKNGQDDHQKNAGGGQSNEEERSQRRAEVLLCFDDASGLRWQQLAEKALEGSCRAGSVTPQPVLLPQLVKSIVHTYDDALWGFRKPVRNIEKREATQKEESAKLSKKQQESQRFNREETYRNMHELSRHLIHSQETLNAAETTLAAIAKGPQWKDTSQEDLFQFCHSFVINLKLRAGAFVDRLDNEIALELHRNNLDQLEKVEELLRENRKDGKDVTKFVGYASILFLPGTFLSGFFSMTFFAFENASWPYAKDCWIWFAAAIPITMLGLAILWWSRTNEDRDDVIWRILISMNPQLARKPV
ncbi:hypothetical protein CFRS1_v014854 [Colletotrichum fructicola]|nr:hypothetical protein CFRS1_v014854 [Colletotrichum fructicola]